MKYALSSVVIMILVTLMVNSAPGLQGDPGRMDGTAVLRRVRETYHSLSTYRDHGTCLIRLNDSDSSENVEFETMFKQPKWFRFKWTNQNSRHPDHKQHGVIWFDGSSSWMSLSFRKNQPEQVGDLRRAILAVSGVSWGTSQSIPGLLSDQMAGIRLDELQDIRLLGVESADGIDCFVVVGHRVNPEIERKLLIGREDHLIRRIEEKSKEGTREEVIREIVLNEPIPDSRFSEQGR